MSDKQKFPRAAALAIAGDLVADLEPFCQRIEIAGSIRRRKPEVSDIEVLFVSSIGERKADMFTTEPVDLASEQIDRLLAAGVITKRPNIRGHFTWGQQNKLAIHLASGIPVDFFATKASNWWVALVIRTGSKETNLRLTTGAMNQQRTLHAYGSGVSCQGGRQIDAMSERQVFELCGVPYLEPHERTY